MSEFSITNPLAEKLLWQEIIQKMQNNPWLPKEDNFISRTETHMPHAADKSDLADELLAGMNLINQNALICANRMPENSPHLRALFLSFARDASYYIQLAKETK